MVQSCNFKIKAQHSNVNFFLLKYFESAIKILKFCDILFLNFNPRCLCGHTDPSFTSLAAIPLEDSSHHIFKFRGREECTGAREQLLSHSQGRYCSRCFCPSNPAEVLPNEDLGLHPGKSTFEVFRKIKSQPRASHLSSPINLLSYLVSYASKNTTNYPLRLNRLVKRKNK